MRWNRKIPLEAAIPTNIFSKTFPTFNHAQLFFIITSMISQEFFTKTIKLLLAAQYTSLLFVKETLLSPPILMFFLRKDSLYLPFI